MKSKENKIKLRGREFKVIERIERKTTTRERLKHRDKGKNVTK